MANLLVAGDLYQELDGQLSEIKRQMRQPSGYPFDPLQLKAHLQAVIEGRFSQAVGSFRYDKRKEGWMLLENIPRRLNSTIDSVSFLKWKETSVNGEEMVRRARVELDANYGQEDAEWVLEHQDKIPVELRKFYLVFPATVWQGVYGCRRVPCLSWDGVRWYLRFGWLDSGWRSRGRLVSPRK